MYRTAALMILLALANVVSLLADPQEKGKDPFFFEKPYLQLGNRPAPQNGALDLQWLAHDKDASWGVEYRQDGAWQRSQPKLLRRITVPGTAAHRVMSAPLQNLKPNTRFEYRVLVDGRAVFSASAMSRKTSVAASRTVIFGDCAANTDGQKAVAYYSHEWKPDMVFITGDIVYSRGRVSEYQEKFWPIYSATPPDPKKGAPLLSSSLIAGVIGNHDVGATVDFDSHPDALAYYLYWNQPENGPKLQTGGPHTPKFKGNEAEQKKFLASAGSTYPNAANFSFDYGTVHWTVIDSNGYTDWSTPALRDWLKADLAAAKNARWRIVALHHPPFNSSKAHFNEQRIRVLSDVFEAGNVSLVLAGHVHNYQRTYPLRFAVEPGFVLGKEQKVPGKWTLDRSFDGVQNRKPNGVIYIVTGAGGANLYNQEQTTDTQSWQEFTKTFFSQKHSFSVLDADSDKLVLRQISEEGKELDAITIEK